MYEFVTSMGTGVGLVFFGLVQYLLSFWITKCKISSGIWAAASTFSVWYHI